MQTQILNVEGMVCDACVGHVTKALQGLDGVQAAQVSLNDQQAVVTYDAAKVQVTQMMEVIAEEGYKATPRAEDDAPAVGESTSGCSCCSR